MIYLEPMLSSIGYGQRLSAISIAFDGPTGALTALGSSEIENVANGTGPIQIPCDTKTCVSSKEGCTETPSNHCDLCLTENG